MIDERLTSSTFPVLKLEICELRLSKEWSWPGRCLLIPMTQYREIHDLPERDYNLMMVELRRASHVLTALYQADKMNVASFGNMVPWLHWHLIPRKSGDPGWPGTPWENPDDPVQADEAILSDHADRIRKAMAATLAV